MLGRFVGHVNMTALDCSLRPLSVHRILQIAEMQVSCHDLLRDASPSKDQIHFSFLSCIVVLYHQAPAGEPQGHLKNSISLQPFRNMPQTHRCCPVQPSVKSNVEPIMNTVSTKFERCYRPPQTALLVSLCAPVGIIHRLQQ